MTIQTYSKNALNLVKQFEGFSAQPYADLAGNQTVGYGHMIEPGEELEFPLSIEEATALASDDLDFAARIVLGNVTTELNQNQFDALCDFVFNIGSGAFTRSTMLKMLNADNMEGASDQFMRWVDIKGRPNDGLIRRRQAEIALFNQPAEG